MKKTSDDPSLPQFPPEVIAQAMAALNEYGFLVIKAESGGSKTALLARLGSELSNQGWTVLQVLETTPVNPDAHATREIHHAASPAIQEARGYLKSKRTPLRPVLAIENAHLDPMGFRAFWLEWEQLAGDKRPLLIVTTRPHFVDALAGQRMRSQLPLSGKSTRFEEALAEPGNHPSWVVDLEPRRDEIFALHARQRLQGEIGPNLLATISHACRRNQERLHQFASAKRTTTGSAGWTVDNLRREVGEQLFKEELTLDTFGGPDQGVARRDAFLRLCAFRRFEALSMRPEPALDDWLWKHRDLVRAEEGSCFLSIHPEHAHLLLEAARASQDFRIPAWVRQPGGFVTPLLDSRVDFYLSGFASAASEILEKLLDPQEQELLCRYFILALPTAERASTDYHSFLATGCLVGAGFQPHLPDPLRVDVAEALGDFVCFVPQQSSWVFREARCNALYGLQVPLFQDAMRRATVAKVAIALASEILGRPYPSPAGPQGLRILAEACSALPFFYPRLPSPMARQVSHKLYGLAAGTDPRFTSEIVEPDAMARMDDRKLVEEAHKAQSAAILVLAREAVAARMPGNPVTKAKALGEAFRSLNPQASFMLRNVSAKISGATDPSLHEEAVALLSTNEKVHLQILIAAAQRLCLDPNSLLKDLLPTVIAVAARALSEMESSVQRDDGVHLLESLRSRVATGDLEANLRDARTRMAEEDLPALDAARRILIPSA